MDDVQKTSRLPGFWRIKALCFFTGLACLLLTAATASAKDLRETMNFNRGWKFQLGDDGRLYSWGYGAYGALGNGRFNSRKAAFL